MILLLLLLTLVSCSKVQKRHEKQVSQYYKKVGKVPRCKGEREFVFSIGERRINAEYPFLKSNKFGVRKITREHFRCRGSRKNLIKTISKELIFDCDGIHSHSLPVFEGKEVVFQEFLVLLNAIQDATAREIIIIEGHRCPKHNRFIDSGYKNSFSKHQVGARVTFFIEGLCPEDILKCICSFYEKKGEALAKKTGDVWSNKYIKVLVSDVIALEVLFDREQNKRVEYSYSQAHRSLHYN